MELRKCIQCGRTEKTGNERVCHGNVRAMSKVQCFADGKGRRRGKKGHFRKKKKVIEPYSLWSETPYLCTEVLFQR